MNSEREKHIANKIVMALANPESLDLTNIKADLKNVDKAYRMVSDAWLLLSKTQAAMQNQGLKKKIDDGTKKDFDALVAKVQKCSQDIADYATRIVKL